jgi:hypothetical protein
MATRTRRNWKPDPRGYYSRQIGWERSKTGKLQQHKFLLGTDRKEAERRERKLRELWDSFVAGSKDARRLWSDDLMVVAKRVAKGIPEIPIPRGPSEKQHEYAARIQRMQSKYPVVLFLPEDQHAFEIGQAALELFESIPHEDDVPIRKVDTDVAQALEEAKKRLAEVGITFSAELAVLSTPGNGDGHDEPLFGVMKPGDAPKPPEVSAPSHAKRSTTLSPNTSNVPEARSSRTPTATLYRAFGAYQKYLNKEYFRPETEQISPWGWIQVRQVNNLKKHHADQLLTRLNADAVDELIGHWRRRPCKVGTEKPMTAKSASNYLGTLVRFLKWLHNSSQFDWSKPVALSDMNTRIRRLTSDHARNSLEQVDTFSLEELKLLMRYGQPYERLLLLLGLNCGFGRAEIASLLVGEVELFKAHSVRHREILDYETTDEDSFIKRIRRKSGVYGEHILFPLTVEGIEWGLERRGEFPNFAQEARLILSEKGTPLDKQTKGGNANQNIPNHWQRLIKRIQDDENEIRPLSFGKLRKTASDLIRRMSTGEVAGVFECHGTPVKEDNLSDAYTNRPFGKVFQAIRDVQEYLTPVFRAAGKTPFAAQAQAYTKRSTIDRVIELYDDNYPMGQIAAAVGLSGSAVSRHIQAYREQLRDSESTT